jgi:hypothetical protein
MMEKVRSFFISRRKRAMVVDLATGAETPLAETEAGILGKSLAKNTCPDCGRNGFYVGPSGDASTNIYCANSDCKAAFNFAYVFGEGHAERIGKAPDWYKYPERTLMKKSALRSGLRTKS